MRLMLQKKAVPSLLPAPAHLTGRIVPAILLVVELAGCVAYHPKPLPREPLPSADVGHLTVDAVVMPLPELAAHRFDPSDGLDMTEVAMLAVVNNPDLKIARDEAGVATAQAFAAGLLPDPQLAATLDVPTANIPGSNFTAYSYGLSYDIGPLLARSSIKAAAAADKRKTDLNLLWQEWQVVAQARLLFVRNLEQKRLEPLLRENRDLLARHYHHSQEALKEGNFTLDAASADFAAFQDLSRQLNELTRQVRENEYALNALAGVAPETDLKLVGDIQLPDIDPDRVLAELPQLASRRPDLLALKAGYESEDQRLRQAIIAQFPALNVGVHRGRDTSDIKTVGLGITINLPVFNRNRGNIAIEEASRQRLYDEYQARLNAALGDIKRILTDQALLERQLADLRKGVAAAALLAQNTEVAYRQGNLTEVAYINALGALLSKRQESLLLEQKILEQRVALLTLIGGEIPAIKQTAEKPL